jgi:hypothetical protein
VTALWVELTDGIECINISELEETGKLVDRPVDTKANTGTYRVIPDKDH